MRAEKCAPPRLVYCTRTSKKWQESRQESFHEERDRKQVRWFYFRCNLSDTSHSWHQFSSSTMTTLMLRSLPRFMRRVETKSKVCEKLKQRCGAKRGDRRGGRFNFRVAWYQSLVRAKRNQSSAVCVNGEYDDVFRSEFVSASGILKLEMNLHFKWSLTAPCSPDTTIDEGWTKVFATTSGSINASRRSWFWHE